MTLPMRTLIERRRAATRRGVLLALGAVTALAAVVGAAPQAAAQDLVPEEAEIKKEEKKEDGWFPYLRLGAGLVFTSNIATVGRPEGEAVTLSVKLAGRLDFKEGAHDWRNTLNIDVAGAYTPTLPELVKTTDRLFFESLYLFRALDWIGPFARLTIETQLLPTDDVRAGETDYAITRLDGSVENETDDRIRLSEAFLPVTLKQSVGAFATPYKDKAVELTFRAGVGALQTVSTGQFRLADKADTSEVEVVELEGYAQIGAEAAIGVQGVVDEANMTYWAGAEVLFPFYDSLGALDDSNALDEATVDFGARLGFKLASWAALDYELKVLRQPGISEDWQVTNSLLLTFGYTFVE